LKKVFLGLLPPEYGVHTDIDQGGFEGHPEHLIHCFDYMRQASTSTLLHMTVAFLGLIKD
jgi:hypothetical protein